MIGSAVGRARGPVRTGVRAGAFRSRQQGAAVAPALVAAALVTALSGCSGDSAAVSPSAPAGSAAPGAAAGAASPGAASPGAGSVAAGSAAATKALETSAGQVRAQVDAVAQPLQSITASRAVDVDDSGPCGIGDPGPWPRRWGYAVRLALRTTDAPAAAKTVMDRLAAQGWTVRAPRSSPDTLDFDAHKGGMILHVGGEPNPSTVTVEGYGRCVGADGRTPAG